ncbi:DUF21 domain-containing protein [Paracoccus liaowanqingii]|uniref:DUF21 domain-containing protein n=1 Tax=Paracoccus liaowanqingii TaxID=2560053 RepID=UPI00143D4B3C|nr:DUF21 domain-containing protein [Paracoccus liaowanqingii]
MQNTNFTLVTILIGNVSINVLLTMLADSVLAGVLAFLFSTVVITAIGEIAPQAYFSRNALKAVSLFAPVLRLYRILLWPLAKPTALLLDAWVGTETVPWFRERELYNILRFHAAHDESEVGRVEAIGATNFLALDDLILTDQGQEVHPDSIISLSFEDDYPIFPTFHPAADDRFVKQIGASGKKWVILVSDKEQSKMLLNAHTFLKDLFVRGKDADPAYHCHVPAVVTAPDGTLDLALEALANKRDKTGHDETVILLWTRNQKRVITGSDVLRCLLSGMEKKAGLPQAAVGHT